MLGVGFGALRELLDGGFRTREQVKSVLNTECLALIPRVGNDPNITKLSYRSVIEMARAPKALLAPSASRAKPKGAARERSQMLWSAVNLPNSAYADAIRSIKLSLDSGPETGCQVIGVTSHQPSEGKSTVAAGIASQLAATGRRVMLIDCDVRNPSLSRALHPEAKLGLLDVAIGEANLAQVMRQCTAPGNFTATQRSCPAIGFAYTCWRGSRGCVFTTQSPLVRQHPVYIGTSHTHSI